MRPHSCDEAGRDGAQNGPNPIRSDRLVRVVGTAYKGLRIPGRCSYRFLIGARYDADSHDGVGPEARDGSDGAVFEARNFASRARGRIR